MTFPKFAARMAMLLALAAATPAYAQAAAPYGAAPGGWGHSRTPGGHPDRPRYYGYARGAPGFYWQPYWAGEQQQHVAPHK